VHVVVDVAGDEHQTALEVLREVRVLLDVVLELRRAIRVVDFADAVVFLAPRVVVDVVLVVCPDSGAGLEESRGTSIAAAVMNPPPECPQIPTRSISMKA
jgi:hypothetical protein